MSVQERPPIVTILGHVDHGKTSLLDYIRKAAVAQKEVGGITQAIGAYQIEVNSKLITFIDTPGHAAFEKMRSRGAKVADIAVLVVALDDGIMPQTIEAIKHILEAKVSMIVAVNKIDLPGINKMAQMEKIKKQLSDHKVLIEEYGGDVPIVEVSAKTGEGVEKLLEIILLVAEMSEIKGDPGAPTHAVVIEANMDKFKGPIATLLVRNGTLKKGDVMLLGGVKGKVRGLLDFAGKTMDQALPSTPVEVLGLEQVPAVGATLGEEAPEKVKAGIVSLLDKLKQDQSAVLKVVIKADKQGSLEAVEEALLKFNTEEGEVIKIVGSSTGDINDADIKLASATSSIVIGFNAKIASSAQRIIDADKVLVRTYSIIYELIDEVRDVVEGMLQAGALEEIYGTAQIVAEFPYGKNEKIAGCRVLDGVFTKGPKVRIVRNEESLGDTKIKSLKKVREEVTRVERGEECGMMFEPQLDFAVGDIIQSYRTL
jgi:translation initiation factor IF-2